VLLNLIFLRLADTLFFLHIFFNLLLGKLYPISVLYSLNIGHRLVTEAYSLPAVNMTRFTMGTVNPNGQQVTSMGIAGAHDQKATSDSALISSSLSASTPTGGKGSVEGYNVNPIILNGQTTSSSAASIRSLKKINEIEEKSTH